ncbi:uncharacterized protein LOC124233754 isoform X2 [Equus quagga]|uniref:uncharacterized protein LOC124233754 isoform X2 n=1 Tax=Equus quagga TaxID=89248 RepID=UPI001EE17452|nr:uncharacterized protein LOC124233754 isoform X2 [Equus quagga]
MEAHNASAPLNFTLPPNFGKRPTDLALSVILVLMLFIVMFSLGCTMEYSKIKAHFWKPKGLAIALVAQYGIMPLTAFALGKVFQLNNVEALAILVCGCSPGGNLSNIFSLAMKGDMNLRTGRNLKTPSPLYTGGSRSPETCQRFPGICGKAVSGASPRLPPPLLCLTAGVSLGQLPARAGGHIPGAWAASWTSSSRHGSSILEDASSQAPKDAGNPGARENALNAEASLAHPHQRREYQRELGPLDCLAAPQVFRLPPTWPMAETRANGCGDYRLGHNPRFP